MSKRGISVTSGVRGATIFSLALAVLIASANGCSSSSNKAGDAAAETDVLVSGDSAAPGDAAFSDAGASDAATTLTFTNVGLIDFAGTSDVVITSQTAEFRTATATITGTSAPKTAYKYLEIDQPDGAPKLGVFVARSFRIEASASATVAGPNPMALVALNKIEIFGALSASGRKSTATAGGAACTTAGKGGGPGGGGALNSYSGAGGGSYCGIGGQGNSASGVPAGIGGLVYGTPTLIPLLGGSSGGGASTFAGGGAGGGAIELGAGVSISIGIAGLVEVGGGGGAANGCGGGSGGAILLEAPAVSVMGILAANGGSGAANTGGPYGQDGQPSSTPATGVATAGLGSAGDISSGGDGSMTGTSVNSSGSGGGGAGRIRINSAAAGFTMAGTVSPSEITDCFTRGEI